ncbi:MAG: DUF481 domain-containing protein [Blastochloris viridis]|uniref:DUF481 domain-containing protein n=1 Tax=Blastochloris viridis TaxID=1079 RepID=A0A6N4R3F5_BLAVI|nr:MAG: DUF481 domain-containing protein [Blastochloris viridis]
MALFKVREPYMPKIHIAIATTAVLVATITISHAEDVSNTTNFLGWNGKLEFGYNAASGNSNTSNLKLDGEARRDWRDWALNLEGKARYAKSEEVRSEENYKFGLQTDRKLNDIEYVFGAIDYEVDNFSGYDYRATETVGYGRKLYEGGKQKLVAQLGAGIRQSKAEDENTETDFLLKPEANYSYRLNDHVTFTQMGRGSIGAEYGVYESETALKSKLVENMYLKASYTVKYTTDVPSDRKNTDTLTGISVGYTF